MVKHEQRQNRHDSRLYTDWLEYAENDIVAAQMLRHTERTVLVAAFHCQQAIEKALKGYFLYQQGYAPDGHNIIFLCKKAVQFSPRFMDWFDDCILLNNCYIQTRYPPDFPVEITPKDVENLCKTCTVIYRSILDEVIEQ